MIKEKTITNFLRASILLLVLPLLYIALWINISGDETLTYHEQVLILMGYFPEFARDPFWVTIIFLGLSGLSAALSFTAWIKSHRVGIHIVGMMICAIGTLLTIWFASTLF
ncbi:MAG: hypothetical protein WD059_09765 [Balneolaceae bacterium]